MMRKGLFVFIGILFIFAACSSSNPKIETNMSKNVADFEYTNQNNESFGLQDLKGKWWVADFIFTNCTTVCLPMTSNMSRLQDRVKEEGLEGVHFISFSVDPEYDTPDVLTEYAADYEADLNNWTFLTGYDFETIKELSIKSFQSMLQEPMPGDDQVMHGTRFYLVNPEGKIIKSYSGVKSDEIDEIFEDLKKVL